jgi:hypothetical protein
VASEAKTPHLRKQQVAKTPWTHRKKEEMKRQGIVQVNEREDICGLERVTVERRAK